MAPVSLQLLNSVDMTQAGAFSFQAHTVACAQLGFVKLHFAEISFSPLSQLCETWKEIIILWISAEWIFSCLATVFGIQQEISSKRAGVWRQQGCGAFVSKQKHEWIRTSCMNKMVISPGLKWPCCFDKLACMQDTCLQNQGHMRRSWLLLPNIFKYSKLYLQSLNFLFQIACLSTFRCSIIFFISHHIPFTQFSTAVPVHLLPQMSFLSLGSSSLACCSLYLPQPSGTHEEVHDIDAEFSAHGSLSEPIFFVRSGVWGIYNLEAPVNGICRTK